ncbi:MAG TPA: glycosyltransferase family 4 protein, partial [Methylobacter sp.]
QGGGINTNISSPSPSNDNISPPAPQIIIPARPSNNFTKLNLVFYVGFGCEPWTPATMNKAGIGGSETAVVEMSKRLASMGHSVRVYGDCPGLEGTYDGVQYIHYEKFKDVECDVFITSRRPHIVDDEFNVRAKAKICWVHDIHCGTALTHRRALKLDRFFVLSQWHKDYFLSQHRFVHPDQVVITRNGIDLHRFAEVGKIQRNPHKAVYSSSPDRGLDVALRVMPRIRQQVPDAELHVFYGFHNWETSAKASNDKGQLDLIDYIKRSIEQGKDNGVVYHGRVNQVDLAHHFMSAGVWSYPTWFVETSCITAMEAQAAGLRIITSPIAALNETVGPRGVMISGDWLSSSYHDAFVDAVVAAMLKSDDSDRQVNIDYANTHFGMDALADEWNTLLQKTIDDISRDILPPYKEAM